MSCGVLSRGPPRGPCGTRSRRRRRPQPGAALAARAQPQALAEGAQDHLGPLSPGKYDWAHLAMHLWPERVVPSAPKTAASPSRTDSRTSSGSRAPTASGRPGGHPTSPLEKLIAERTSPAVKAALEDLLGAGA